LLSRVKGSLEPIHKPAGLLWSIGEWFYYVFDPTARRALDDRAIARLTKPARFLAPIVALTAVVVCCLSIVRPPLILAVAPLFIIVPGAALIVVLVAHCRDWHALHDRDGRGRAEIHSETGPFFFDRQDADSCEADAPDAEETSPRQQDLDELVLDYRWSFGDFRQIVSALRVWNLLVYAEDGTMAPVVDEVEQAATALHWGILNLAYGSAVLADLLPAHEMTPEHHRTLMEMRSLKRIWPLERPLFLLTIAGPCHSLRGHPPIPETILHLRTLLAEFTAQAKTRSFGPGGTLWQWLVDPFGTNTRRATALLKRLDQDH
jgi:hypothetical protein